ncbi:TPA: hypothetical protein SMT91_000700 [Proteus mirabilis]|nr:hypothetical protein [Proteus mirabilis]
MGLRNFIYKLTGINLKKEKKLSPRDLNQIRTELLKLNKNTTFSRDLIFSGNRHRECDDSNIFFGSFLNTTEDLDKATAIYHWGTSYSLKKSIKEAKKHNIPLFLIEDGFLRSLYSFAADVPPKLKSGISFTVDTKGFYYDGFSETDLEIMLNTYVLSDEEKNVARKIIAKIVDNKLSKYNNQPLDIPHLGHTDKPKVLVIDQSYGDMSLQLGMVTDDIFHTMIIDAIQENPNHEIIFKTHPDTIAKNTSSKFLNNLKDKITILTEYTNPISLLSQVDKVYVASSQMGFEALMCGKDVHVYGLPFYAGWGLTMDKQSTHRRKRVLTVEELFYIVYVKYSYYVNPKTHDLCTIDEAIDYLLELRKQKI